MANCRYLVYMDHYTAELAASLPTEALRKPVHWVKENLKIIAQDLCREPSGYRLYGCYWWGVKYLLRQSETGSRSAWFRGPCQDEEIRHLTDHGAPALNLHAALEHGRLWDDGPEWLERDDAALGIYEWNNGDVELYRLSDTDTGHQLDLFEMADLQEQRRKRYLETVSVFLPRTWRSHGDRALENADPRRAAVCYQRMIHLSTSHTDRSEAWLLLGMTYDQMGHYPKAIFCYENLYERENEHWILGNIATSHFQAGNTRRSIEYFEQALKLMPGNPEFAAGLEAARLKLGIKASSFENDDHLQLELAHA